MKLLSAYLFNLTDTLNTATQVYFQMAPMILLATASTATSPATIRIGLILFSLALPPNDAFSRRSFSRIDEEIPLFVGSLSVCFTVLSSSSFLELNNHVGVLCNRCCFRTMRPTGDKRKATAVLHSRIAIKANKILFELMDMVRWQSPDRIYL